MSNNRTKRRMLGIVVCGKEIKKYGKSGMCSRCIPRERKVKDRPSVSEIQSLVSSLGWEATGRKYGVSGNAVKKWMR